jgi:small GTP-binding protein
MAQLPIVKIVLIGDEGVGKTSLIRRYCETEQPAASGTDFVTRRVELPGGAIRLSIWDVASDGGRPEVFQGSRAAALVYDVTRPASLVHLKRRRDQALLAAEGQELLVVGNKIDLRRVVRPAIGQVFSSYVRASYLETSALTGEGVTNLFETLAVMAGGKQLLEAQAAEEGEQQAAAVDTQAQVYLDRVQAKVSKLAEDFNSGAINQAQFQNLYSHYQKELRTIEALVAQSKSWQGAVTAGESVVIRRQHGAEAVGYAIYDNESGMPLRTIGEFQLDPALLVPMLSSYRTATTDMFGSGIRSVEIEQGSWLCFVPGEYTTMLAVFSNQPADQQFQSMEQLHSVFEQANRQQLGEQPLDPDKLVFPHEFH